MKGLFSEALLWTVVVLPVDDLLISALGVFIIRIYKDLELFVDWIDVLLGGINCLGSQNLLFQHYRIHDIPHH